MLEDSGIKMLMNATETLCGVTFRVASVSRDLTHRNIMLYKIGFSALFRSLCLRHNQRAKKGFLKIAFQNRLMSLRVLCCVLADIGPLLLRHPLKQQHSGKMVATLSAFLVVQPDPSSRFSWRFRKPNCFGKQHIPYKEFSPVFLPDCGNL